MLTCLHAGPGRDLGSKPWRLVGHLLGHEGRGSLTEALRSAGLVQELSAGMGDEVRGAVLPGRTGLLSVET